ncbi:E3 SUMO-protein ligase SIZ1 [Dioscorea cayenensis subsp. rotundata]|uniref:E3 SUMO-protein ligase SIZ1 n=1 Tax=Dioscorea cayennensis subsp. rotundata TaxID=55577 RepID=A0AB40CAF7_DIOCR|nr:E3 SUMO-protein ligase SIZ1 [Dioscorea cayenensis subsp. rotundata]
MAAVDLVSGCKDKLAYFRIKELKDVLGQLGLAKQGKKQDLVDRILAVLSDEQVSKAQLWGRRSSIGKEGVAKIIDDTYRKMQSPGATDLATRSNSGSDFNHTKPNQEVDDSYPMEKFRCLCGSSLTTESTIKCEDLRCSTWQHVGCVIIPEKPMDGVLPAPPTSFYCEICRINRADPFWVTMSHPLLPMKLSACGVAADGTSIIQTTERTFNLTRVEREMLQRSEFDLQIWCILLNDKVPFRMQWPQYTELQVNANSVRTTNRPGSQMLGINGRDDGATITTCSREGINKILLSSCDPRVFCLGIRIAKKRTKQQVLNMIPSEANGERFEEALARVCRCIGGGTTKEDADSDSDIEVVADSVTVNLRCPMSGSRIKTAGRFKPCVHMGCFDLETFIEMNQRSRKWQCPICLKNYSLENIIIDPYFNRITSLMRNCGEDVTEIDVKPDGSWRAKSEGESRVLAQWHLPDGSLCPPATAEVKPKLEVFKAIKQEGTSEGHTGLKLGIKKNRNGIWEVSKPEELSNSPGNHLVEQYDNPRQNVIAMSSSATGSYRDGEDPSVNQEGGGPFDFSPFNNGLEQNSFPVSFDAQYDVNRIPVAPSKDADVIVLSDSDEDNITLISPENGYETGPVGTNGITFSANQAGISEGMQGDLGLGTSGTSCLRLFSNGVEDFEMPPWPLQPGSQAGNGFQLFDTETDVPAALADGHSFGCTPMNGHTLASDGALGETSRIRDLPTSRSNSELNGTLVDNPLAFGNDDPSLQIFLPSGPAGVPMQADLSDHIEFPNGARSDDWISLSLAGGGGKNDIVPTNALNSRQDFAMEEDRMETLANTASLLKSVDNNLTDNVTSNHKRSENFFTHQRQQRSVKSRLYLSIDTDSD